jgi:hypothetical protein
MSGHLADGPGTAMPGCGLAEDGGTEIFIVIEQSNLFDPPSNHSTRQSILFSQQSILSIP